MYLLTQARYHRVSLAFLSLVLLSSCLGGTKADITRYYLIDPEVNAPLTTASDPGLNIDILDLQIPQYLERFQIVTRSAENRLRLSEFNQWGENLRENLIRTMARNLSTALSPANVTTPVNRGNITHDYRIHIEIDQFEHDIDKRVKLSAHWELAQARKSAEARIETFNASSKTEIEPDDYDGIVSSMQSLFADLSRSIAESILQQEQP